MITAPNEGNHKNQYGQRQHGRNGKIFGCFTATLFFFSQNGTASLSVLLYHAARPVSRRSGEYCPGNGFSCLETGPARGQGLEILYGL